MILRMEVQAAAHWMVTSMNKGHFISTGSESNPLIM